MGNGHAIIEKKMIGDWVFTNSFTSLWIEDMQVKTQIQLFLPIILLW